ncbi:MAG: chromosomal replication initiator protein DnaA [Bacteroidaceae bacterium]|nr:chromosomal replication initiator protein DnaA [Bacteroidaceae bacterium]
MAENKHIRLWNNCLQVIKDNIPDTTFKTWFAPIVPIKFEDNKLTIQVPSHFFYEYIEEQFVDLLREAIHKEIGDRVKLMYTVLVDKTNDGKMTVEPTNGNNYSKGLIKNDNKAPSQLRQSVPQDLDPHLNPNYSFDNFIEGYSNKLSRTAGETIACDPSSTTFNPLFIYGPSGVGKTHLINAIGRRIKRDHPEKRVLYVSAHLFQVQYTDSVRNNVTNDFLNFYQTIDILIMDDVQEFAGATKTQNTFFHIFNHLHQNGKRLIMTSDRPPIMLAGMEDRLLTRFKWGLVAELEKPNVELRKEILRKKIEHDGLVFPEEVINYIAENVDDSVRDLEGIVLQFIARSTILNKEIDLDLAEYIVNKAVRHENKPITIESIVEKVCAHYDIDISAIHQKTRRSNIVKLRQIAMFLAKKYTNTSTTKIGLQIGNKNHATVLHSDKIIKGLIEVDKKFRAEVEEIEKTIRKNR